MGDVQVILRRIASGDLDAYEGRRALMGQRMPNEPARLIKEGRWASKGQYEAGDAGLRQAARDALRALRPEGKS